MKACFMGLGYIGLPTSIIAASNGIEVCGVDINLSVVEQINSRQLNVIEPGLEGMLRQVVNSGVFKAYTQPQTSDAYFIVVPTPFKGEYQPDISYVESATKMVVPFLKEGDLYVIESTSPVGTTEKMAELIFRLRPDLKGKIYIAYCPERVLPGNIIRELVNNDRVIGGIDELSTKKASGFYSQFVKGTLYPTNCRTAEMCKLVENSSRDVQIAFANELSMLCESAEIDVWELIELANKHPRVNILSPGCGVGGHCIAVDPYFITSAYPENSRLIAKAREINNYKALWCAERVLNAILKYKNENCRKPRIAMMGLAFKPDVDDLRESPAAQIVRKVIDRCGSDCDLSVSEPNVSSYKDYFLTPYQEAFDKSDIIVYLVAHSPFKELPKDSGKIILDFCGICR